MQSSGSSQVLRRGIKPGRYDTAEARARSSRRPGERDDPRGPLTGYFWDRIHCTSAFASASGTVVFGGMGTWPHTPTPPFLTLSTSLASAALSPRYLLATSL